MSGTKRNAKYLIEVISAKTHLPKDEVSLVLDHFFGLVVSELEKNNVVFISGFGKFYNTIWKPRNTKKISGEIVAVGPSVVTNFKLSRELKNSINKKYLARLEKERRENG